MNSIKEKLESNIGKEVIISYTQDNISVSIEGTLDNDIDFYYVDTPDSLARIRFLPEAVEYIHGEGETCSAAVGSNFYITIKENRTKGNEMNSITRMSRDEVNEYLYEHRVQVFLSYTDVYDKDGNFVEPVFEGDRELEPKEYMNEDDTLYEFWGFSGKTGFSTFDIHMNEDKAKYAAVMFLRLVEEYDMCFSDAETLASSYVTTYNVMIEPLTEKEQEEIRQRAIAAIEAGNIRFAATPETKDEH